MSGEGKVKVLLVDDNSTNRMIASVMLKNLGCETSMAADGEEAVAAMRASSFDLVIMDLHMPILDGISACKMIKEPGSGALNPQVPVVAMTASAILRGKERCIEAGMADFLTKPLGKKDFERTLARWVPSWRPPSKPGSSPSGEDFFVFNEKELLERLAGDAELLKTIAGAFLKELPESLDKLAKGFEAGNMEELRREAHSLKGSAASVSAEELRAASLALERAATEGSLEKAKAAMEGVSEKAKALQSRLARLG